MNSKTRGNTRFSKQHLVITVPVLLVNITGAMDVLTDYALPFAGKIIDIAFAVKTKVTTGAKALTFNAEINATNVNGGRVAITSANCASVGVVVAGSAVVADNSFNKGDTLSIEAGTVTAFAEGEGYLLITIEQS